MKGRLLFLISIVCLALFSCEDDSKVETLKLSASSFPDISSDGSTLKVDITCAGTWTASSNAKSWCTVTPQTGTESQTITIHVDANLDMKTRKAIVTVSSNGTSKAISISQKAASAPTNLETYHYRLPVIFHVLYKDKNDAKQYVKKGRLTEILEKVNELYRHAGTNSADMNLEFVLAAESPSGETLAEPGIERIEWSTNPMDIEEFMFNNDRKYNHLIWEPNDYINVMIYTFTDDKILGVSHFPYTPEAHPLAGTDNVSSGLMEKNLAYAYCLSINNTYIYEDSPTGKLNQNDAAITLAHELGHYLGLYHAFSEASQDDAEVCKDTDYCDDTPTYDRTEYENWLNNLPHKSYTLKDLCQRYDCVRGTSFTSRNLMDYSYSYLDQFTQNQKTRVRHILSYSPLIPGPKKNQASTRTAPDGVLDLPIRVMK